MATFYVVRHAKAGSRSHWTGDDRQRPLSKKGVAQAEAIATMLRPHDITAVHSSPYLRCVQTVEPLAQALKLEMVRAPALAEGRGVRGLYTFFADQSLERVVLCTHGDVVYELVEDLTNRRIVPAFREQFEKGSTWVVEVKHGELAGARYIPAP